MMLFKLGFLILMLLFPCRVWAAAWGGWGFPPQVQLSNSGIGTTSTDGLIITNPKKAAAGAQQISPRIRLTGQGWKTNATAASQTVDWIAELVPVQGAANPQARLNFNYQINGGGYQGTPTMSLLNNNVGIGTEVPGTDLEIGDGTSGISKSMKIYGGGSGGDLSTLTLTAGVSVSGKLVYDASTASLTLLNAYTGVSAGAGNLIFGTNNTERMRISRTGNVGIWTTSFGTNAAGALSLGAGTAPTTSPADVSQIWTADWNGAGTNALFIRTEEGKQHVFGSYVGFGTVSPGEMVELEETVTITGAVTDGYAAALRIDPGYTAATAQTVTRHNYIDIQDVSVAGVGPAAVTDAAVLHFDADVGTHKALAADGVVATVMTSLGPTGAQTTIQGWLKINVNGTLRFIPFW